MQAIFDPKNRLQASGPDADRGKPPLQDFRQRKWTWPLGLLGSSGFEDPESVVLRRLFQRPIGDGEAPMEVGVRKMEAEVDTLLRNLQDQGLETDELASFVGGWIRQLRSSTAEEVARFSTVPASRAEDAPPVVSLPQAAISSLPDPSPVDKEAVSYLAAAACSFMTGRESMPWA